MTLHIGLTGGIASGKSTASHYFKALGACIIDSDRLARQATAQGSDAYQEIIKHYGKQICLPDGELNRQALRECIFANPDEKKWLESLLHPIIQTLRETYLQQCQAPYCLSVIPLLTEKNLENTFDRVLVIDTLEENQISRGSSRDQKPKAAILNILNQQADRLSRLSIADDVIFNNSNLQNLKEQVAIFHQFYTHYTP